MDSGNKRNFFNRITEGIVAIAMVLVFFFVLILVFNSIFPEGSGLHFIFDQPDETKRKSTDRDQTELQVARGDHADFLFGDSAWAATLVRTRNLVKSKKADAIAWQSAREGIKLGNLDAVQTLDASSATIKFDDSNFIELGDNSLIVIRRMEKDLLFKEKRSFMVVVDGELRGRIGGGDENNVYLEVTTPNAVARLQSNPDDQDGIEFKIDVMEDAASAVTIYSGSGEVEAQGETVILGKNQLTRIEGELAPTQPVTLPDPVSLIWPAKNKTFPYRSLPPRVKFSWKSQPDAKGYHLLLSSDEEFTDILIDKKLRKPEFMHGNLRQGNYYWKVSSMNSAGEGAFGIPRGFTLVQDQLPPPLEVSFPPENVTQKKIEISGKTEPTSRVYISGAEIVPADDGVFRHDLQLKRGINVIVVEAVDPAGNISYQSRLINSRY